MASGRADDWKGRMRWISTVVGAVALWGAVQTFSQEALTAGEVVQPTVDPEAERILDELERDGADLRRLSAALSYSKTMAASADEQVRLGRLYYVNDQDGGEGVRRFGVVFDTLILDPSTKPRREPYHRSYVFDGEWLVERDHRTRTAWKRQVVAPGERFDPLRVGEGPFPIPLGQKKADILSRYVVEALSATDGLLPREGEAWLERRIEAGKNLASFVAGAVQLRLVPRPEMSAEDEFVEIRLWYVRDGSGVLLPRMARTEDVGGDVSLVYLKDVAINERASIPVDAMSVEIPAGWDKRVEEWRGRVGDPR